MKKLRLISLILVCCILLSGCESDLMSQTLNDNATSLQNKLAVASVLSEQQLYTRALDEFYAGAKLHIYSTTSILGTVIENFMNYYPRLNGMVSFENVNDTEDTFMRIIDELSNDSLDSADLVLIQNGANLSNLLLREHLSYNYFPRDYQDVVTESFQYPVAPILINSLLIANKKANVSDINNIWQLVEEPYVSMLYFKNPDNETVNMNFLVMLTSVEWTRVMESSYQEYYGKPWESSEYLSPSYEWISRFLTGADLTYDSSSQIMLDLSKNEKPMISLSVFSKIRNVDEDNFKNLDLLAFTNEITGFSGFMYQIFASVLNDTDCPYTAALFINYLLSENGFASKGGWNEYQGYYSPNITIKKDKNILDYSYGQWKDKLVLMDLDYILNNKEFVMSFINNY